MITIQKLCVLFVWKINSKINSNESISAHFMGHDQHWRTSNLFAFLLRNHLLRSLPLLRESKKVCVCYTTSLLCFNLSILRWPCVCVYMHAGFLVFCKKMERRGEIEIGFLIIKAGKPMTCTVLNLSFESNPPSLSFHVGLDNPNISQIIIITLHGANMK